MKFMIIKLSQTCFITSLLLISTSGHADDFQTPSDRFKTTLDKSTLDKVLNKKNHAETIHATTLSSTSDYLKECCPDKQEDFCYSVKITNKSSTIEAYTAKLTYKLGTCPVAEITDLVGSDGLQMPPRCPVPLKYSSVSSPNITTINVDPNSDATLHIPEHGMVLDNWNQSIKNPSIVIQGHEGLFSKSIKIDDFKPVDGLCLQIRE